MFEAPGLHLPLPCGDFGGNNADPVPSRGQTPANRLPEYTTPLPLHSSWSSVSLGNSAWLGPVLFLPTPAVGRSPLLHLYCTSRIRTSPHLPAPLHATVVLSLTVCFVVIYMGIYSLCFVLFFLPKVIKASLVITWLKRARDRGLPFSLTVSLHFSLHEQTIELNKTMKP